MYLFIYFDQNNESMLHKSINVLKIRPY